MVKEGGIGRQKARQTAKTGEKQAENTEGTPGKQTGNRRETGGEQDIPALPGKGKDDES